MSEREPQKRISRAYEIGKKLIQNTVSRDRIDRFTLFANMEARKRATAPVLDMASRLFTETPSGASLLDSNDINQAQVVILPTLKFDLLIERQFNDDRFIAITKRDQIDDGLVDQYTIGIDVYTPDGFGLLERTKQVHYFNKPTGSLVPRDLKYKGPEVEQTFVEPDRIDYLDRVPKELDMDQIFALENVVRTAIAENQ